MKKILITFVLTLSMLKAVGTGTVDTSLKYPIENFGKALQWNLFYDEFKIFGKVGYCDGGQVLKTYNWDPKTAVGFSARIIEPVAIVETTNIPWFFVFLGLDLGKSMSTATTALEGEDLGNKKFIDFSNSRTHKEDKATPFREAHIFRFPVFGLILKSNSMLCFDQGKISPLHFSEFDPRWENDLVAFKFDPMILSMINPEMMLASILDCLAATTSQGLDWQDTNPVVGEGDPGFLEGDSEWSRARVEDPDSLRETATNSADLVRNTMFWSNGCVIGNAGSFTGWLPSGSDPLAGSTTLLHRLVNFMHIGGLSQTKIYGLRKSTNITYKASQTMPGNVNSMCSEKSFPMIIKSQYKFQLAYPTVGKGTELGTTPPGFTSFKNIPGSRDDAAFFLWKKRDFYAGAYSCGGVEDDEIYE